MRADTPELEKEHQVVVELDVDVHGLRPFSVEANVHLFTIEQQMLKGELKETQL